MTNLPNFIHIDEMLPPSRLKWAVWGGLLFFILGVIGLLNLPLSYRLLLDFLAVVCVGLNHVIRPQLGAISTLSVHPLAIVENLKRADISLSEPLRLNDVEWQLAVKATGFPNVSSELWQGYLLGAIDTSKMLILNFCIIEPQIQQLQVTVWQDQCTPDAWRQLKTICHLIKE